MIIVELEIEPIAEELEHPLKEFKEELKELFETYGWRVKSVSNYDDED